MNPWAIVLTLTLAGPAFGSQPPDPESGRRYLDAFEQFHDSIVQGNRERLSIQDPAGIDRMESVDVNGQKQWISVRGSDRHNPVVLYLHGGPGAVTMPFAYLQPPEWEQHFVVVHWDQRGTGKTRCANPGYDPANATFDNFFSDTEVMVRHLLDSLGKEKLIVLGHSWGSILGLHLARTHPEWLHAYVGTGQVVNTWRGEKVGYDFLLAEAEKRNDAQGLAALKSIAPYPDLEKHADKVGVQRHYMQEYGASLVDLDYWGLVLQAFWASPAYSICDWMGFINTQFSPNYPHRELTRALMQPDSRTGNFDGYPYEYEVPIFFFLGALDYHTPTTLAVEYFEKLTAPHKKLVLFEHSAHAPTHREAGAFIDALVEYVRPMALE